MTENRIRFLDGLRGIAIIFVVLFHAYVRWPTIVPYGDKFASFPVFKNGFLGVQLFFLISGFVILMSLEKNKNLKLFLYQRWLRLFPAMLIATIIIFTTTLFLFERPSGQPVLKSIIPGLLFLEPKWIKIVAGIEINPLEGTFWSLFVEVKFYFVFGFLYFILGKKKAILGLILLYLSSIYLYNYPIRYLSTISTLLSLQYFGWFAAGCMSFLYFKNKKIKYLYLTLIISVSELYFMNLENEAFVFGLILLGLFIFPIYFEKIRIYFSNQFFSFFGFVSYPLYLIHENAMVSLIVKTNNYTNIPYILLPIFPLIIITFISYLIAYKIEPYLRKMIQIKFGDMAKNT